MENPAYNRIPNSSHRLSVIIPVLNEEEAIEEVIEEVRKFSPPGAEILVVDNNSIDRTAALARSKGVKVEEEIKQGKGNCVRTGAKNAGGEILVFIDGDGTYPPAAIKSLIEPISRGNSDLVYASRFLDGRIKSMSFGRYWGNRMLSWIASVFFKKTSDLLTGFFAIGKDHFLALGLKSTGFEIETEIFIKACKRNYRLQEIPIALRPRKGKTKFSLLRDGNRVCRMFFRHIR